MSFSIDQQVTISPNPISIIANPDNALLEALNAARRSWYVFPLPPGSKAPFPGSKGVKDATNNVEQIKTWAEKHPGCNWAVAMGPSRLAVLDIDRHGEKNGFLWLERSGLEMEILSALMKYRSGVTGGDGRHLFFQAPKGMRNGGVLLPGLDLQIGNRYVILAGSIHLNGNSYEWNGTGEEPLAPAELLVEIVKGLEQHRSTRTFSGNPQNKARAQRLADEYLEGNLPRIPLGARHDTLARLAAQMTHSRPRDYRHHILEELMLVNDTCCEQPLPNMEVANISAWAVTLPARKYNHLHEDDRAMEKTKWLKEFLSDCTVAGDHAKGTDLREAYWQWAKSRGVPTFTTNLFHQAIKSMGFQYNSIKRKGHSIRAFRGLKLRSNRPSLIRSAIKNNDPSHSNTRCLTAPTYSRPSLLNLSCNPGVVSNRIPWSFAIISNSCGPP